MFDQEIKEAVKYGLYQAEEKIKEYGWECLEDIYNSLSDNGKDWLSEKFNEEIKKICNYDRKWYHNDTRK